MPTFNGILAAHVRTVIAMNSRHEGLAAWRQSIALAGKVYAATRQLPSEEPVGLVTELRRAALAIPSSIAEGSAGTRRDEFVRCLYTARSALSRLQTRVVIAVEQGLIGADACPLDEVTKLGRELDCLLRRVRASGLAAHARACAPPRPER